MSDYKTDPLLKDAVFEKLSTRNKQNLRREQLAVFRLQVDFCVFLVNDSLSDKEQKFGWLSHINKIFPRSCRSSRRRKQKTSGNKSLKLKAEVSEQVSPGRGDSIQSNRSLKLRAQKVQMMDAFKRIYLCCLLYRFCFENLLSV